MQTDFKSFFQRWIINTLSVLVACYLLSGIRYGSPMDLIGATLILGILNAVLRPLLLLLSLPLLVFTLGLFTLVINAVLLLLVSLLMGEKHFQVDGFGTALWGALIISITSIILNTLTGGGNARIQVKRGPTPPERRDGGGNGPVIDV